MGGSNHFQRFEETLSIERLALHTLSHNNNVMVPFEILIIPEQDAVIIIVT